MSFLARICSNKLSWCQQCAQTDGKNVKTVMASSVASIGIHPGSNNADTPCQVVLLQTIAYIQAHGIYSLSYTMPLKPLAAKASVFNRNYEDDVASSVTTEPDFTEEEFYIQVSKMLGYFYCDIVGLEGASVLRSDQP